MARTADSAAVGGKSGWQWGTTAETRRGLLEAARAVFAEDGFTNASVAKVVERAGSSVGSLYHHFGGKTELFIALWEDFRGERDRIVTEAIAKAQAGGETDPINVFVAGARAWLGLSWTHRDLELVFTSGDSPPGFEQLRREHGRVWVRDSGLLLNVRNNAHGRLTVLALTMLIGEAGQEITASSSKRQANALTTEALKMVRKLDPRLES